MICRTWTASTTAINAPKYIAIASTKVLAELKKVPGFKGAILLNREEKGEVRLMYMTFWESMAAIRAFAGDDASKAVVLPEAEAVLTRADHHADHWELAVNTGLMGNFA